VVVVHGVGRCDEKVADTPRLPDAGGRFVEVVEQERGEHNVERTAPKRQRQRVSDGGRWPVIASTQQHLERQVGGEHASPSGESGARPDPCKAPIASSLK
jgi:hypothetical protein